MKPAQAVFKHHPPERLTQLTLALLYGDVALQPHPVTHLPNLWVHKQPPVTLSVKCAVTCEGELQSCNDKDPGAVDGTKQHIVGASHD